VENDRVDKLVLPSRRRTLQPSRSRDQPRPLEPEAVPDLDARHVADVDEVEDAPPVPEQGGEVKVRPSEGRADPETPVVRGDDEAAVAEVRRSAGVVGLGEVGGGRGRKSISVGSGRRSS
jgi:hypothetical protein